MPATVAATGPSSPTRLLANHSGTFTDVRPGWRSCRWQGVRRSPPSEPVRLSARAVGLPCSAPLDPRRVDIPVPAAKPDVTMAAYSELDSQIPGPPDRAVATTTVARSSELKRGAG